MAISQIPAPSEPLVHPETGRITRAWFQFFLRLVARLLPNGGPAPSQAGYIVTAPDPLLPDARVATDSATVLVNLATPGQIAWDAIGSGLGDVVGPASATDNAISRYDGTTGKLIQNSGITIADGATGTLAGSNSGDVTLAGTPDYLTIAGQVVTRGLIDLATDVTGDLPYANLTPATAASRFLVRGSAGGSGDWQEGTFGANLTLTGTVLAAASSTGGPRIVGITVDGGGVVVTTGGKGFIQSPVTGTITKWTLLADVSGSVTFAVTKDAFGSFPPTTSIVASAPPLLSGAQSGTQTSLGTWTTAVTAGDVFGFAITGTPATITRVTLQIEVTP